MVTFVEKERNGRPVLLASLFWSYLDGRSRQLLVLARGGPAYRSHCE